MIFKQSSARVPASRCRRLLPLLLVPGIALSSAARAAEGDVLRPYVGISVTHDDNIQGTSKAAIAAGTPKLSDTARRVEAGILFDKTISQQRLTANVNLDHTSFNRFSNLDYNGRDIAANWNWHVGSQFEGNLGATHSRTLTSVQDSVTRNAAVDNGLPNQLPNIRTQNRQYFDGGWLLHPSWRLRGGLSHYELNYEQQGPQVADRRVKDGELGVDYLARSGSSFGVQFRRADGDFVNSPLANYTQDEVKARIDWKVSGKTDLLFLAGWVQRDHDQAPANDYSGFNGRVNGTWRVTGKTTLTAGVWREIGALDDQTASYSLNRGISLGAGWEITRQIRLDGIYQHERRDYTPAGLARKDLINYSALQLSYYPIPKLKILTSVYRTSQGSNVALNDYNNFGVSIGTRYEF